MGQTKIQDRQLEQGLEVTLADDATLALTTGKQGMLEVYGGNEFLYCNILADGTVTSIVASTNTAITDSDGNLCVYDGGTGAVIKNRLGAQYTFKYSFRYIA